MPALPDRTHAFTALFRYSTGLENERQYSGELVMKVCSIIWFIVITLEAAPRLERIKRRIGVVVTNFYTLCTIGLHECHETLYR